MGKSFSPAAVSLNQLDSTLTSIMREKTLPDKIENTITSRCMHFQPHNVSLFLKFAHRVLIGVFFGVSLLKAVHKTILSNAERDLYKQQYKNNTSHCWLYK